MKWVKRGLFIIIFIIGLCLIFNSQIASFILDHSYPDLTKQEIVKNSRKPTVISKTKIKSLTPKDLIQAKMSNQKANYVGYVSVPSIGLKQPVINELSNYALSVGASVYNANQVMGHGNYVLASHFSYMSESQLFSPLYYHKKDGARGQYIYLTDLDKVYVYKTTVYKVIKDTDVQYVAPTDKAHITLFTCNYKSEWGRVLLQGKLEKTIAINKFKNADSIF